jgi:hypothetical protein
MNTPNRNQRNSASKLAAKQKDTDFPRTKFKLGIVGREGDGVENRRGFCLMDDKNFFALAPVPRQSGIDR